MTSARLRPPPYGRELLEKRAKGLPVNVFVYCGRDAWRLAEKRPRGGRLAVPEDTDWRTMDFECATGLELVVVSRGWDQDQLDDFCQHLIRAGVKLAVGILVVKDRDLPAAPDVEVTYYKPELRRVAA